jgi:hypothetical protein
VKVEETISEPVFSVNDWGSSVHKAISVPEDSLRPSIRRNYRHRIGFALKNMMGRSSSAPPFLQ